MKKILIVDDSDILLKTLQTSFKKYQKYFLPIFAKDGLEAMNLLDAHSIDLVVTDIQMPMIDGVVLLAFIRERYPAMPCIVITAYGNEELKDLIGENVLHIVNKPIHVNALAKIIVSELSGGEKRKTDRIPIRDFLNLLVTKRKTCVFKLEPDDGQPGYFYFYKGDLYSAACGNRKGKDAILKILAYENANLIFSKPPEHQGKNNIKMESSHLIQFAKNSKLFVTVQK